jgi:predicted DNA-binding transcriptional regulator AlpA
MTIEQPTQPATPAYLDDLATLDCSQLGKLIGRSTKSIRIDMQRRPNTLPMPFKIPGTRKHLWRVIDVRAWMQALADYEAERRAAVRAAGGDSVLRPFHLGRKDLGAIATAALNKP